MYFLCPVTLQWTAVIQRGVHGKNVRQLVAEGRARAIVRVPTPFLQMEGKRASTRGLVLRLKHSTVIHSRVKVRAICG